MSWIQVVVAVSAGPPEGGSYLNPPDSGGLCDGVITMPSARPVRRPRLYAQDGLRYDGGGREPVVGVHHDVHPVGGEDLERGHARGLGERVRVPSQEQRAVDVVRLPVQADRLRHGHDMGLVEREGEGGAAMARRPEGDALPGDRGIRPLHVVRRHELRDVHELRRRGGGAGERIDLITAAAPGLCRRPAYSCASRPAN